jgi:hypothetical protein
MNQLTQEQLEQHVTILGWLHVVGNLFFLIIGAFVFFLLSSIGAISGDAQAVAILSVVGSFVAGILSILGLPGMVAGLGLLARKTWARYLAIVLGILNLLNFPIGTVVGAYTLWVLMQEKVADYFALTLPAASSLAVQR